MTIQHQLSPADSLVAVHVLLPLKSVTTITHAIVLNIFPTPTGSLGAKPELKQVLATTSVLVDHGMAAFDNRNVISARTLKVTASYAL